MLARPANHRLAVEEPAPAVGDDPDYLIDVLDALTLQCASVFFGHDCSPAL